MGNEKISMQILGQMKKH